MSIYASKRQEHCFDFKLWNISDALQEGLKSIHRNFHVPCNTETNSVRNSLRKGSMEISMYPVTSRLILFKNAFT